MILRVAFQSLAKSGDGTVHIALGSRRRARLLCAVACLGLISRARQCAAMAPSTSPLSRSMWPTLVLHQASLGLSSTA